MWPVIILTLVTAQRLAELIIAKRNTAALLASGGHEVGAKHYPIIVVFHTCWIVGLWLLARTAEVNWLLISIFAVLQAARVWVLATLGARWTTRIIIMANAPLVLSGPFQFLKHPNYLVVALEIFVLPAAFGLYAFALITGVINLCILAYRIKIEEHALSAQR